MVFWKMSFQELVFQFRSVVAAPSPPEFVPHPSAGGPSLEVSPARRLFMFGIAEEGEGDHVCFCS